MQHSDERPPTSGRPSLLSLDQQAEADRHRILSGLDSTPAPASEGSGKSRRGMYTWLAAGATVLALGGGAGLWLMSEGEKEIVAAGSAPLPAAPAPAAALAGEAPPMRGTAEDVPAAAILNDTREIAAKPDSAVGKKHGDDELTKMLEHGMPAASAKDGAVPAAAAEAKGGVAVATAAHPPVPVPVPARAPKPARTLAKAPLKKPAPLHANANASNLTPHPRAAATPAAKKKAETKAAVPVDNDVALLAALVAHAKATQPKTGTGVAAKLKQCKSLDSVAEANQCRARICAGAKNEAECKS